MLKGRAVLKVYALIGPSGTGKSYKAITLASEKGIEYIIDDGLLIKGNKIVAGVSAKKELTRVAAVRRALFMDEEHAKQVRDAIKAAVPDSILILGTSAKMIDRIVSQLNLPTVQESINIHDISSGREIRLAQKHRYEQGKHVIPVPTFEIRKDFSGYFIDPLKIFRIAGKGKKLEAVERTVVRPTYSYMGKFYIADTAVEAIAVHDALNVDGVVKVLNTSLTSRDDGLIIYIELAVKYGYKIHAVLESVQLSVAKDVDRLTGMNVIEVNVTARNLVI
jgi:uncharacterized alkaline shock family protein YloU